jgi:hypothetical protein
MKELFNEPEKVRILSPGEGTCPECAVRHDPREPHYRGSLYYQMRFQQKNGRLPTWKDAMSHCIAPVQDAAVALLRGKGIPESEIFGDEQTGKAAQGDDKRKAGKKKRKEGKRGG